MTKQVPADKPLSPEDRAYLHARGEHALVDQIDERFGTDTPDQEKLPVNPESPPEEVPDDYDRWTVQELQDELGNRSLSKAGKKEDLIARLREDNKKPVE